MRAWALGLVVLASCQVGVAEMRCGWFDNSTPGNMSLLDRDGSWNISVQGGEAVDDDSMAIVSQVTENQDEFVRTNRNNGFSCACLTVDSDIESFTIVKIHQAKQLLLKQCLEDIHITPHIPLPFK
ncbi:DUF4087 domain-containing protein [Vibrio scophthalmi]|uniref:DUF4087 domain-containing protein n=1 Tax=Vibrio scophthalmi TaxID=45658 RepID=A0A1E3WI34_9VIBR|nr:DUF4087 domain-containing protein [Vibrio scophthalmi]ODS05466.1 hypothetical protein VSF3289_04607 [Vibrio scophthalmi]